MLAGQSFQLSYRQKVITKHSLSGWSSGKSASDQRIANNTTTLPADESTRAEKPDTSRDPRRRKRSADYPAFSYETTEKKSYKAQIDEAVAMKYKGCGCENVKFQKPPTVVIPQQNIEAMGILDQIKLTFLGGFENGVMEQIGISASRTRLLKNRSYSKKDSFMLDSITVPPSLSDLSYPATDTLKGFWVTVPARFLTCIIAYFVFPYITSFVDSFVTLPPEELDEITSKFGPGVSILYGTFISLTLSILYQRVKDIQDAAAKESATLTLVTRNLLSIFKSDRSLAIEAAQCCADQIRTLVKSSRGAELMLVMYSDPYARMLDLIELREEELYKDLGNFGPQGALIGNTRDTIKDLLQMRAERLSIEALSLPPTHFSVLNSLTLLILLSFTVSTLPVVDHVTGLPPNEGSILFAILSNVYVLFYFFAKDLNDPFDGVYQIRRSSSACHLLEAKWLIVNHPLLQGGEVDFEEVTEGPDGISVYSPGLGEMIFENDLFVDGKTEPELS